MIRSDKIDKIKSSTYGWSIQIMTVVIGTIVKYAEAVMLNIL